MSMSNRPKIFVPLDGQEAQQKGSEAVKRLMKIIFERGVQAVRENRPLPPTFIDLFGRDIDLRAISKSADAEDFMRGAVLQKRERIILDFIKEASGVSLPSTTIINESMLADVPNIISFDTEELFQTVVASDAANKRRK